MVLSIGRIIKLMIMASQQKKNKEAVTTAHKVVKAQTLDKTVCGSE